MKQYFCCSDVHGYFREFKDALRQAGFDICNPEHIVLLCGDAFDRGSDAKRLLDFLVSLHQCGRLVYVKGNHEYLMEHCLQCLKEKVPIPNAHWHNKTLNTISQLTRFDELDLALGVVDYTKISRRLSKYRKLVSKCVNYYELGDYIFVHGWIPHIRTYEQLAMCQDWEQCSWYNGMQEWDNGWRLDNKTIICGHWHTSFGNYNYHHKGSGEFEKDADFSPFIDDGIIALDGCTAFSKIVNVIKISEDGYVSITNNKDRRWKWTI